MTRETKSVDGIEENEERQVSLYNNRGNERNNLASIDSVPDSTEVNNSLKSWLSDDDCIADAEEDRTYCIIEEQVELKRSEMKIKEAAAIRFLAGKHVHLKF